MTHVKVLLYCIAFVPVPEMPVALDDEVNCHCRYCGALLAALCQWVLLVPRQPSRILVRWAAAVFLRSTMKHAICSAFLKSLFFVMSGLRAHLVWE